MLSTGAPCLQASIPEGVTKISERAFDACSSLESITIPSSVTKIGYAAFWGCKSLTRIIILASAISFEAYAFEACPNLTIHAPAGSKAQKYAKTKGIKFEAL